MCGLVGYISKNAIDLNKFKYSLDLIEHRGPDSSDIYLSDDNKLGMGFRRLSIIDLSSSGNQPMNSQCGKYIICFNGEIYNFLDLKRKIIKKYPNFQFTSSSDTEVFLNFISIFGLKEALACSKGMFAFALFNKQLNKLFLVRDRAGEKPMYFRHSNDGFFFGSELKSFISFFRNLKISIPALNLYIAQGNIPAPHSIFENVFKLMPGTILSFSWNDGITQEKYWELGSDLNDSIQRNSFDDNYRIFEDKFLKAVESQTISDVPLGAFLSGGLDSSCIVAALKELNVSGINTHTVAYTESRYDESDTADLIARSIGSNHHEYLFRPSDAFEIIPNLAKIYCEPFSDSSQIPTYFLSEQTKANVTVSLSGDGGDELFGGYNRYLFFQRYRVLITSLPHSMRAFFARLISFLLDKPNLNFLLESLFTKIFNAKGSKEKLEKICELLNKRSINEVYYSLLQQWQENEWPLDNKYSISSRQLFDELFNYEVRTFNDMRRLDFLNYLPNDVLTKVDRASMHASLESRAPFLDADLIEFAFSLPSEHLLAKNKGKLMLRKFLSDRLPENVLSLPKTGFGVPIEYWLRHELKDWAHSILFDDPNIFNKEVIREIWDNHQSKKSLNHHKLWSIIMFNLWIREYNIST